MDEETIAALATPEGRGGIAVVRLSGPETPVILPLVLDGWPRRPRPWQLYRRTVRAGGEPLCDALAVFFRGPRSYTGEDAAEISIPASPLLAATLLAELCRLGARPALPGEFTYRAFRNGRIDLIQAEAVQELVEAHSRREAQLEFATGAGGLSRAVRQLRDLLVEAAVQLETEIEFQEEHEPGRPTAAPPLAEAQRRLDEILGQAHFSERARSGLQVVIAGRVNAGKSTLFNALLMSERAITSPQPGTTRDYLCETIELDGFPLLLTDAAGIRGEADAVEHEGVRRSRERIAASQAAILLLDAAAAPDPGDDEILRLLDGKPRLLAANKSDIAPAGAVAALQARFGAETVVPVSALTGANLDVVRDWLHALVRRQLPPPGALAVNRRQRLLLERVRDRLRAAGEHLARPGAPELAAEELHGALAAIGELTGAVSREDLLNAVFGRFCVGK